MPSKMRDGKIAKTKCPRRARRKNCENELPALGMSDIGLLNAQALPPAPDRLFVTSNFVV
jgi:hypothetical protein